MSAFGGNRTGGMYSGGDPLFGGNSYNATPLAIRPNTTTTQQRRKMKGKQITHLVIVITVALTLIVVLYGLKQIDYLTERTEALNILVEKLQEKSDSLDAKVSELVPNFVDYVGWLYPVGRDVVNILFGQLFPRLYERLADWD